jgi:hypothetical protein
MTEAKKRLTYKEKCEQLEWLLHYAVSNGKTRPTENLIEITTEALEIAEQQNYTNLSIELKTRINVCYDRVSYLCYPSNFLSIYDDFKQSDEYLNKAHLRNNDESNAILQSMKNLLLRRESASVLFLAFVLSLVTIVALQSNYRIGQQFVRATENIKILRELSLTQKQQYNIAEATAATDCNLHEIQKLIGTSLDPNKKPNANQDTPNLTIEEVKRIIDSNYGNNQSFDQNDPLIVRCFKSRRDTLLKIGNQEFTKNNKLIQSRNLDLLATLVSFCTDRVVQASWSELFIKDALDLKTNCQSLVKLRDLVQEKEIENACVKNKCTQNQFDPDNLLFSAKNPTQYTAEALSLFNVMQDFSYTLSYTIMPFLLGMLGASCYVARLIVWNQVGASFDRSRYTFSRHLARVLMGGVLALVVGMYFASYAEAPKVVGVPLVLASFLVGYGVEIALSALDSLVRTLRDRWDPARSEDGSSAPTSLTRLEQKGKNEDSK